MIRAGVRMLLGTQPDMDIVGEAATGREAIQMAEELGPAVVLMDISLPDMDGFKATQEIKRRHPGVAVLALTMYDDEAHFLRMISKGASGYLPKRAAPDDLVFAIRAVHGGGGLSLPLRRPDPGLGISAPGPDGRRKGQLRRPNREGKGGLEAHRRGPTQQGHR